MRTTWAALLVVLAAAALPIPGFAGQLLLYPALGLVPGLALADGLFPRESRSVRIALAIALSPLLTTLVAWIVMRSGGSLTVAARTVIGIAAIAAVERLVRSRPAEPDEDSRLPGAAVAWALGLAIVVLAVPLINPYIAVRGDAWIHGAIVTEISTRGIPPQDPRMAGVPLNYVWFFNLFIALLTSVHEHEPFRFMSLFDAANAFATVLLVAAAARRLAGRTAAHGAAALLVLGLNAGAFLLWPLWLVKSFTGEVRGMAEVVRQVTHIGWGTANIIDDLSAPFGLMVSFLDKLLLGTAINYGYLEMIAFIWALILWIPRGPGKALAVILLSTMGMMLFHSVVGLSVVPTALLALGVLWVVRGRETWLPSRSRLAIAAAATGAGALLTYPYVRSITSGWDPHASGVQHRFLQPDPPMLWTIVTSCFFPLLLMVPVVRDGLRSHRPRVTVIAAMCAALTGFALVVNLPDHNSAKFVFEIFTLAVLLASPAVAGRASDLWRSHRRRALVLGALFVIPSLLTIHGYLLDRTGNTSRVLELRPGEARLYGWLRTATPRDAVIVDRGYRNLVAVRGARRLFLGTDQLPQKAAFPAMEMHRRQRVMTDLYGAFATPDSTVAGLRLPGRPVYVLYRPEDPSVVPRPWERLREAAPGSELVYDHDGYHVVRLATGGAS